MGAHAAHLPLWRDLFPHWDFPQAVAPHLEAHCGRGPRDESEWHFAQAVDAAPKIELHVHVEAAVPQAFYETLAQAQATDATGDKGASAPAAPLDQAGAFADFIAAWLRNSQLVRDESSLEHLAEAFVASRARQNIRYTEAHLSLVDLVIMRRRRPDLGTPLDFSRALMSFAKGLRRALVQHPAVDVRIILDLLWLTTQAEKEELVETILPLLDDEAAASPRGGRLIIGIGLGGPEIHKDLEEWASVMARCKDSGLLLDIHCGETADRAAAAAACAALRPHRVSHGIAGAPDWIFRGPITACPLSNVTTGCYQGPLAQHPGRFMASELAGASIATDDPLLFGTNLTLEFVALRRAWGWEFEDFFCAQERADAAKYQKLI